MHDALTRLWYRGGPAVWPLLPLSWLYAAAVSLRRALYRRGLLKSVRLPRPVVVVGNLTVGGTGKTPLVIWLAQALGRAGLRVGIVSRGYRGRAGRSPQRVTTDSEPAAVGDEPVLIARRTGRPVWVSVDRPRAAQALLGGDAVDLILSDDGLQHYRLARDVEIAVIDGERGLGNGLCLPAGPLREPRRRLAGVDLLVVNGGHGWPAARRMVLAPGPARRLVDGRERPLESFAGSEVHAVAAIGNPQRFFALLEAQGLRLRPHVHRDHARPAAAQICFDDGLPVLMTEKDAVKCTALADHRHWFVPVEARFGEGEGENLLADIRRLAGV